MMLHRKKRFPIILLLCIVLALVNSTVVFSTEDRDSKTRLNVQDVDVKSKTETIYSTLNEDGKPDTAYVVNELQVSSDGMVHDFGKYSSTLNLTTPDPIAVDADKLSARSKDGKLHYQGTLVSKELPWLFTTQYRLDGKKVSPKFLAGKSGTLQISLNAKRNPKVAGNYYDNYMTQITVTLNGDKTNNIDAGKGSTTTVGRSKMINFIILPGNDGNFSLTAQVKDFEMSGITISSVPFSMIMEMPNTSQLTEGMKLLANGTGAMSKGASQLTSGSEKISSSTYLLSSGSKSYLDGMGKLNKSSSQLTGASAEIRNGLKQMATQLENNDPSAMFASLAQLPAALNQISDGLSNTVAGLTTLSRNYNSSKTALQSAINDTPVATLTQEQINTLMANNPGDTSLQILLAHYQSSLRVKGTYAQVSPAFDAVENHLPQVSGGLHQMSTNIANISTGIDNTIGNNDLFQQFTALKTGLSSLSDNYDKFHAGLLSFAGGAESSATAYGELNQGLNHLNQNYSSFHAALIELRDGANQLDQKVAKIPDEMKKAIGDIMNKYDKSSYKPQSFTSDKNTAIDGVQFLIKTQEIKKPEAPKKIDPSKGKKSILSRLLDLFR